MILTPGTKLGPYEILAPIGAGGMGEVYRAHDPRVGRDVAIKVSSEQFTDRFTREIHAVASLNHSNVCTLYDVGSNYLVMELVEGPTLADRIKQGPIPLEESLEIAKQIADALESAHEKGIVHRDLKPGNIKLRPDGTVKVLDFGLAKVEEAAAVSLETSPTLSVAQTAAGVLLGTAAYMSPEQARGKTVDKRADIWAFGCVLFEMLTGQAAFQGEDVTEILAAVVKGGANLDLLPANLHPRLREAITRCLQKDLKKRYRDIGDARYEVEQALADPSGVLVPAAAAAGRRARRRTMLPWIAGAVILGAILAGVAVWKLKSPEPRQVMRFDYTLPEDQRLASVPYPVLAISPDGKQFVYNTSKGIYLRSIDEFAAKLIPGTEGGINSQQPFFSADGKSIGYYSAGDRQLKKVAISGGAPLRLCDTNLTLGASWGADDTIVYAEQGKGIMRVPAAGGMPKMLFGVKDEAFYHPRLLPGGKSVLFTLGTSEGYKVAVQSLESQERKILFPGDHAWYLPTGHIVYASGNSVFAVPFDLEGLQTTGAPVLMLEGLFRSSLLFAPQYALSASGTLIYLPRARAAAETGRTLVWVDKSGKEEPLKMRADTYNNPRISPDGKYVAFSIEKGGNESIWIWDLVRETPTRLTFNSSNDNCPLWTPDGRGVIFSSDQDGGFRIYGKKADGTGEVEKLGPVPGQLNYIPACWADNGKTLILGYLNNGFDIGAMPMEGDHALRPLLTGRQHERNPRISPDGRWMAYCSNESGQMEVYVRAFPEVEKGGRWQVSPGGGENPLWSPDGKELYYRGGESVMAVSVKTEPVFSRETPKMLFRGPYISPSYQFLGLLYNSWDLSPDGKHFLMMKEVGATQPTGDGPRKINIVMNWTEELKRILAK